MFLPSLLFVAALATPTTQAGDKDLTRPHTIARPVRPQRDVALVIGVEAYRNVSPLDYAVDDAQSVARALIESGGFAPKDVVTMTSSDTNSPLSPTRTHIMEQLALLKQRDDIRLLVVYFSGHGGAGQQGTVKENYLYPLDVSPAVLEQTGVPMSEVLRLADEVPATARLLLVDACRDTGKGLEGRGGMADPGRAYDLTGTVTIFATAWDRIAEERPELEHGLFTYYLLDGLRGRADGTLPNVPPDAKISLEEVYAYTRRQLQDEAARRGVAPQRPVREGREVEGGDLLILPVPGAVVARCPDARSEDLDQAQQDAVRLCAATEPERFLAATRAARQTLDCLVSPLTPEQDVRDHQLGALYAQLVQDEATAAAEWAAATRSGGLALPAGCSVSDRTRALADAIHPDEADTPAAPREGRIQVGGAREDQVPKGLPSNIQVVWGYGVAAPPVRWDGVSATPVLSDLIRPPIAAERQRATRLALGSGGSLVVAGALWAGSAASYGAYEDLGQCFAGNTARCPEGEDLSTPRARATFEQALEVRTDALAGAAVLAAGAAAGLGVWSIRVAF